MFIYSQRLVLFLFENVFSQLNKKVKTSIITTLPPGYLIVTTAAGRGDRAMPSQRLAALNMMLFII